jgi:lysophospholipid acyltransferase (LPLAT)-like uncharacterized protein
MKIRHPLLVKTAGRLIAWVVRLWISTLRYRCRELGPRLEPTAPELKGRYIYAFWHEMILLAHHYRKAPLDVLISEHADGEMIAQACGHLGMGVVRGSTTRGGLRAMREIVAKKTRSHLIITPDGPRGPRQKVQPGVVYLAARAGLPVVPVGFACKKGWRFGSWDRFILPRPFTQAVSVFGEPIHVPREADKEQLEQYRQRVEEAMIDVMNRAEEMAQGGKGRREPMSAGAPSTNGEKRCETALEGSRTDLQSVRG